MKIPSWRPDITQPIDIVEEIVRIRGYNNIETLEPEKIRTKDTLNKQQKLFHFLQRSVASKSYYETITWSFTDSKLNQLFKELVNFEKWCSKNGYIPVCRLNTTSDISWEIFEIF